MVLPFHTQAGDYQLFLGRIHHYIPSSLPTMDKKQFTVELMVQRYPKIYGKIIERK